LSEADLKFDVIILGAGPAGSSAALVFEGSGLKVALIDKAIFPRHKTCGDAIPGKTQKFLRPVWPEIDKALADAPAAELIKSAEVFSTNGLSLHIDWKLTASELEDRIELESKEGEVLQCKILIACDGANSIAAKQLTSIGTIRDQYGFAVAAYYSGIKCPENTNLIFLLKDFSPGYFWIFPLGEGLYNVGYGMLGKPPKGDGLKGNLKKIIEQEESISPLFSGSKSESDIYAFGLPMGGKEFKPIVSNRLMLCGDAAYLIDPLQGHGIDKAVRSGILAAETAIKSISIGDCSAGELKKYQDTIYAEFGPELKKNFKLMELLGKRSWLLNAVTRIAQWEPMAKLIRKLLYA
jgi:flavin-dependent dehydrogenase